MGPSIFLIIITFLSSATAFSFSSSVLTSPYSNFTLQDIASDVVLVLNSTVQPEFAFNDLVTNQWTAPRNVVNTQLIWSWRFNQSLIPANYTMNVLIARPDLLSSIDVTIPPWGSVPIEPQAFNVTFNCSDIGVSNVTFIFIFTHPDLDFPEMYSLRFQKSCAPQDCTGKCGPKGSCLPNGVCQCEPGWDHTDYCTIGFWTSQTEVCVGETFLLEWNSTNRDANSALDWILIGYPNRDIGANWNYDSAYQYLSGGDGNYMWSYMSGDHTGGVLIPEGSFEFSIAENVPGTWVVVYYSADQYIGLALITFTMLNASDPRCNLSVNQSTCVASQGYYDTGLEMCVCDDGYFGENCQHGCGNLTVLNNFGQDFHASVDKLGLYKNSANCGWLIAPTLPNALHPAAITLIFYSIDLEPFVDKLTIYVGDSLENATILNSYDGIQSTTITLTVPSSQAMVVFITNANYPSWPSQGILGWNATFYAQGCPAGSSIMYQADTGIWNCIPCAANSFSMLVDTMGPCPPCDSVSPSAINHFDVNVRKMYEQSCGSTQIARWRTLIATLCIIWTSVINAICFVIVILRRSIPPLHARSSTLLIAYTMGSTVMVQIPLMDLAPGHMSCAGLFWIASLRCHLIVLPVLLMLYRLKILLEFQVVRRHVARILRETQPTTAEEKSHNRQSSSSFSGSPSNISGAVLPSGSSPNGSAASTFAGTIIGSAVKSTYIGRRPKMLFTPVFDDITQRMTAIAKKVQHWSHPGYLVFWLFIILLPAFFVTLSNWFYLESNFESSQTLAFSHCYDNTRMKLTDAAFFCFYATLFALGLYSTRVSHEAFGLKIELFRFAVLYCLLSILYFVITLSADLDSQFNTRYLLYILATVSQFYIVLKPSLETLPSCTALFARHGHEDLFEKNGPMRLEEILASRRGFRFFLEHCRREFSEENLLAFADIEEYRRHTSKQAFQRIYAKYLATGAPFMINIPGAALANIRQFYSTIEQKDLSELQLAFNEVQGELIRLMETDTFLRFCRSELFERYLRGDKIQTEEDSYSYDSGTSRIGSTSPKASGSPELASRRFPSFEPLEKQPVVDDDSAPGGLGTLSGRSTPEPTGRRRLDSNSPMITVPEESDMDASRKLVDEENEIELVHRQSGGINVVNLKHPLSQNSRTKPSPAKLIKNYFFPQRSTPPKILSKPTHAHSVSVSISTSNLTPSGDPPFTPTAASASLEDKTPLKDTKEITTTPLKVSTNRSTGGVFQRSPSHKDEKTKEQVTRTPRRSIEITPKKPDLFITPEEPIERERGSLIGQLSLILKSTPTRISPRVHRSEAHDNERTENKDDKSDKDQLTIFPRKTESMEALEDSMGTTQSPPSRSATPTEPLSAEIQEETLFDSTKE